MKSLMMKLGVICILLASHLSSVFAQGVLTIEISDTLNAPVSDITVAITDANGKSTEYQTDALGRVIDNECPVGSYTYVVYYGDYKTGSFNIKSGEPTWINLDYRRVGLNYLDEKGRPVEDIKVTLFKKEDNGTKKFVKNGYTNSSGLCLFVVPEGKYVYSDVDGEHEIEVSDKNINTFIEISSKLITYATSFEFVKNGEPVKVLAKDILVYQQNSWQRFGTVIAHSETISGDYFEYSKTENQISCPVGNYSYSVDTKLYGTVNGNFSVLKTDSQTDNVIQIDLSSYGDIDDVIENNIIEYDKTKPTYTLYIMAGDCSGSNKVYDDIPTRYLVKGEGVGRYRYTNPDGIAQHTVNEGTYDIQILGSQLANVDIFSDTTIRVCFDKDNGSVNFHKLYFKFYLDDKEVYPQTIKKIAFDKFIDDSEKRRFNYEEVFPKYDEESGLLKFDDPIYVTEGSYYCDFNFNEYNDTYDYARVHINEDSPEVDTIKFKFKLTYNVTVNLLDKDSMLVSEPYRVNIHDPRGTSWARKTTNGQIIYQVTPGEITINTLGQTLNLDIQSDSTINIVMPETRNVYFKFMHDGEIVNPNITSLEVKKISNQSYDYEYTFPAEKSTDIYNLDYIFKTPAKLPIGTFRLTYEINDYEFNSPNYHTFVIPRGSMSDTTIYVVIPVKRTVEISIKDGNEEPVVGVYGSILKYDEDGKSKGNAYDGSYHGQLLSDAYGIIRDHLVPGRYQLSFLDIKRDFIVTEYGLSFTINSKAELYDTEITLKYKDTEEIIPNVMIDIEKDGAFFSSPLTDKSGKISMKCEPGVYTYNILLGSGTTGEFTVVDEKQKLTVYIDKPILVDSIIILVDDCVKGGDTVQATSIVLPSDAEVKDVIYSVDDNSLATISEDGKLTTNKLGFKGYVTIIGKAKDGSHAIGRKTIKINDCDGISKKYSLTWANGETEIFADNESEVLVVTPSIPYDNVYYRYQISSNQVKWTTLDETTSNKINVSCSEFNSGRKHFRAIVAESKDMLDKIENGEVPMLEENTTNTATLKIRYKLVESITLTGDSCLKNGDVTYLEYTVLPKDAYNKNIKFTIDKSELAYLTTSFPYSVTANEINKQGIVNITANATDGSNIVATLPIQIGGCADEVVLIEKISLSSVKCLNNEESTKITASILPENATSKELHYSVDDKTLATIADDGTLTANSTGKIGEVIITARATDGSNVYKLLSVNIGDCGDDPDPILVSNITLTADECVDNGESTQITATVSPDNATSKEITFSVDDATLATISSTGLLTANAVNKGNVTITAKATDGSNVSKSITVKIGGCDGEIIPEPEKILVSEITLTPNDCVNNEDSVLITAAIAPDNATSKEITFSVDDATLATISSTGLLTANAVNKGNVTITAKATDGSNVSKSITVKIGGCDGEIIPEPEKILVSEITLTANDCVNNEDSVLITAAIAPDNATSKEITFSVDDVTLATISNTGLLTANAVNKGNVTITAKATDGSNVSKSIIVKIGGCDGEIIPEPEKILVSEITLVASECVSNEDSVLITAAITPDDATSKEITFSVDDVTLATISNTGLLTANAVNKGNVTVTAKATDGSNVSKSITVKIGGCNGEIIPEPEKILVSEITLAANECVNNGESTQITATIAPDNATSKEITFSVDDVTLATISNTGLLTTDAENKGNVTVTAKATDGSNVSKSITVKIGGCDGEIIPEPEKILVSEITLAASECVNNGESTQITATIAPDNATSKEITFSVDDVTLATISNTGLLTANAVNKGNVTITAKATDGSNVSKSITVKIGGCDGEIIPEPEKILISEITLAASECVNNGESTQIVASVGPENATNKELVYSVDNEVLATISSTGLLTANSTGLTGVVTVTAQSTDGSEKEGSVEIKIGNCDFGKYLHIELVDGTTSATVDYNNTVTIRLTTYNLIEEDLLFTLWAGPYDYTYTGDPIPSTELHCVDFYDINESICGFYTKEITFRVDSQEDYIYCFAAAIEKNKNGYSGDDKTFIKSNMIKIDIKRPDTIVEDIVIPTVFTPTEADGANDDFMPGYEVVIYNRVGDVICVSSNGWDGKYKGKLADAGVYIYHVTLKDGKEKRGTIQLYKE